MKFHDDRCKGKAVMRRKPKCGRQTDRQTDMVIPVYPPNFVAGGIISTHVPDHALLHTWIKCIHTYSLTIHACTVDMTFSAGKSDTPCIIIFIDINNFVLENSYYSVEMYSVVCEVEV